MSNKIVLYCKSYAGDVQRVKILFDSILKHNKDKIPLYLSVPVEDVKLFKNVIGISEYILVTDQEISHSNLCQSWKNQQIIKMMFWKLDASENYVVLDSDSYFIRDFYIKDFLINYKTPLNNVVPYTVMHEQKDLFSWTSRYVQQLGFDPMKSFSECRKPIMDLFDRNGRLYDFGPVPVIWSATVWKTLEEEYIKPNNLSFEELVNTVSSEFSWYGEWLLIRKPIELWPIEPMFKVFHYLPQYHEHKQMGYTEETFSKNYLGLVMQSSAGCPLKY
jgi:hypothetical protein